MGSGKGTVGTVGALGGFGARLAVWVPYAWLVVFFLVPFLIVLRQGSQSENAVPPYVPVLTSGRLGRH